MNRKFLVPLAALLLVTPFASRAADEGASLYKAKCSGCHGANGEGKSSVKAPPLKGTNMDSDQIVENTLKGKPDSKAPHNKGISGVNEAQAKAIAEYVKSLK
jgi:mono/diheme cytochrome c family protein